MKPLVVTSGPTRIVLSFLDNVALTITIPFSDKKKKKKFYDVSYSMKPSNELHAKISSINVIEYQKSGYYRE